MHRIHFTVANFQRGVKQFPAVVSRGFRHYIYHRRQQHSTIDPDALCGFGEPANQRRCAFGHADQPDTVPMASRKTLGPIAAMQFTAFMALLNVSNFSCATLAGPIEATFGKRKAHVAMDVFSWPSWRL